MKALKTEKLGIVGIIAAAFLAGSCCWLPLLLAGLGAGGLGLGSALAPYRPYFLVLTGLMLAAAWYAALRPRPLENSAPGAAPACEGDPCCQPSRRRRSILALSFITLGAILFMSFPWWSAGLLARSHPAAVPLAGVGARNVRLHLRGWTCEACGIETEKQLARLPGVVRARSNYGAASVDLLVQPHKVTDQSLRKATEALGYHVEAIDRRPG